MLIILLPWNNASDTTPRIRDISFVSWDNVHMNMKDTLPCCLPYIDSNIVSVRMILLINNSFNRVGKFENIKLFLFV